jgi:hypothetical protein
MSSHTYFKFGRYIPAFWWHWVHSEGASTDDAVSIAVNFWIKQPHHGIFVDGCNLLQPTRKCGHEPKYIAGDAASWPALNWTLEELADLVAAHDETTSNSSPKQAQGYGCVENAAASLSSWKVFFVWCAWISARQVLLKTGTGLI